MQVTDLKTVYEGRTSHHTLQRYTTLGRQIALAVAERNAPLRDYVVDDVPRNFTQQRLDFRRSVLFGSRVN